MFLVRVQTMVKNRIRALLAQHPVGLPEVSDLFGKAGSQWLRGLTRLVGPLAWDNVKQAISANTRLTARATA